MERLYSPKEAGRMLGITTRTLQVWDRQGRIRCIRLPDGQKKDTGVEDQPPDERR